MLGLKSKALAGVEKVNPEHEAVALVKEAISTIKSLIVELTEVRNLKVNFGFNWIEI